MRVHLVLIALIGLLLLAGAGNAALIPDQNSLIYSNAANNWMVVNHQSTITVYAYNTTALIPVSGATVTLTPNSTTLGSLGMNGFTTDSNGQGNTTFTAGKTPGAVNITAIITYKGNSVQKTFTLNIDHDVAYSVQFNYDNEVTVGTETPFQMSFTDQWGNPIDNRNPYNPQAVSLHIGSVTGAGAFDTGGIPKYVQDLTMSPDANGNVSVTVRTDIVSGENVIWMKAFGAISDQYEAIDSLTDGVPFSITQTVSPSVIPPPSVPCDGVSNFTFIYTLYDMYGNIAGNQTILLHTNWTGDTDSYFTSNQNGQIYVTYGPHQTAAAISVTATSVTNTSVNATQNVVFYSTAPVNMELVASPQTIGSFDATGGALSTVVGEVTDTEGNPVPGAPVTFSLGTPWYDATYNSTYLSGPAWNVSSAKNYSAQTVYTNSNGMAIVMFQPGTFDKNATDLHYNQQATGHVTVTATWTNVVQNIQLNWENFPYLSVSTGVNPLTVGVGQTVDLTIKLVGNGFMLQKNLADVVLVTDQSGSMADNPNGGTSGTSKLSYAKTALQNFVALSANNITVGLASFANAPSGYSTQENQLWYLEQHNINSKPFNPYDSVQDSIDNNQAPQNAYADARIDQDLTTNTGTLDNVISTYSANGGTCIACGLNAALSELNTHATPGYTQSVVLMTDGIANLAPINSTFPMLSYMPSDYSSSNGGTSQIAAAAAIYDANAMKAQGIEIFTIGFGSDQSSDNINVTTLETIASNNCPTATVDPPVCYWAATDGNALNTVYQTINGIISSTAGVNTTMAVQFNNINVTGVTFPGANVCNYTYNSTPTVGTGSTVIQWQKSQGGNTNVTDQTSNWTNYHSLNFTIGTMYIGDTWQADALFNMTMPGNVQVFGDNSMIVFNNGTSSMLLPVKYVNVIANLTNSGWTMGAIQLSNLQANPTGGTITNSIPVQWNLTYPGNITKSATEQIFYSNNNQQSWVQFNTISNIAPCNQSQQYSTLDVTNLPAGTYWIRVVATADDATGDQAITSTGIQVGTAVKAYIKLE
jgi:hypothetical protein